MGPDATEARPTGQSTSPSSEAPREGDRAPASANGYHASEPTSRRWRQLYRASRLTLSGTSTAAIVAIIALAVQRTAFPFAALFVAAGDLGTAFAIIGGSAVVSVARTLANERIATRVRENVFDAFLRAAKSVPAPLGEPAEVVSPRFAVCMPELVAWAQGGVVVTVAGALSAPIALSLLFHELGAKLFGPMLVGGLSVVALAMLASPRVSAAWQVAWERSRGVQSQFFALHQGLVELRAQGKLAPFEERLRGELGRYSNNDAAARRLQGLFTFGVAALAAGAAALAATTLTPNVFAAGDGLARGALLVVATLPSLVALVSGIGRLVAARSELSTIASLRSDAPNLGTTVSLDPSGELRFEEVGFTYPATDASESRTLLIDTEVTLSARGSLAIVGPNGSGKTTLLHLICGVLRPDRGRILLNGAPAELDDERWHAQLAFVPQRPLEIREASIADNIRLVAPAATNAEIVSALRDLGVWSHLRARTTTDASVLSLKLGSLSRGEARRVTLARAFVRPAGLVVLDEPEANLDADARADVLLALRRLSERTRVVVAVHDRSMTAFAKDLIELRASRVEDRS